MSALLAACGTIRELLEQMESMGRKALGTFLQRLPWVKQICEVEEDKLPNQEMLRRFLDNPFTIMPDTWVWTPHKWQYVNKLGWQEKWAEHQVEIWRKFGIELSDDVLYMYRIVLDRLGRRWVSWLELFDMRVMVIPELSWLALLGTQNKFPVHLISEELRAYESSVGAIQAASEELMSTRPGIYLIKAPSYRSSAYSVFPHFHEGLYYGECEAILQEFSKLVSALGVVPIVNQLPTFLELMVVYTYLQMDGCKLSYLASFFDRTILRERRDNQDGSYGTLVLRPFEQKSGTESRLFELVVDQPNGKRCPGKIYPFVMLADTEADEGSDSCRKELEILRINKSLPQLTRPPTN